MHNVEGVRIRNMITSTLGAVSTVDLLAPEPRTQYNQGRSRVLRIRAARTWVNCSRVPLDLLFVLPPIPCRTDKGLWSHRCSWATSFPDIFGVPGRGRRGCANLIRRSRGRNLQQLHQLHQPHRQHQHASEEEGFGGRRPVCVNPTATRTNGWWRRRRRKGDRR